MELTTCITSITVKIDRIQLYCPAKAGSGSVTLRKFNLSLMFVPRYLKQLTVDNFHRLVTKCKQWGWVCMV